MQPCIKSSRVSRPDFGASNIPVATPAAAATVAMPAPMVIFCTTLILSFLFFSLPVMSSISFNAILNASLFCGLCVFRVPSVIRRVIALFFSLATILLCYAALATPNQLFPCFTAGLWRKQYPRCHARGGCNDGHAYAYSDLLCGIRSYLFAFVPGYHTHQVFHNHDETSYYLI
jgi:hypothetical protein